MPRRLAAILVLALAAPAAAAPTSAAPTSAAGPGPESVELRFDWPPAASARVNWDQSLQFPKSTRKSSPKMVPGDAVDTYTVTREAILQTFRSRGTMRIDARRSGDEIAIAMRDVDSSGAPPPFSPNTTPDFVLATREMVQVLRADGTVARLENTESLRDQREERLGIGVLLFGDDYLPSLARDDEQEASDLWGVLVAEWAGRRVPLGVTTAGEATGRLPRADATVPHRVETLARRVPCGVPFPPRCVEIVVRREASAEVLGVAQAENNRSLPAVLKPATGPQGGGAYVGVARVVTDPATLLPVHLSFDERYDMPGMEGASFGSSLEMDFAWDPPPGPPAGR